MKKLLVSFLILSMVLSLFGGAFATESKGKIGVSMPTQSLQRWNQDGENLKTQLEAAGYEVLLQYAGNNEVPLQISQIENMILEEVDVLLIAAIEANSLSTVLSDAKAAGIKVIAYDRLINESDAVNYYVTFDNYKVGQIQGQYLETALDLANIEGSVNMEFVAGDPGDTNAPFFFQGAFDVIAPYIESGKVVVPSGQTEFAQVATLAWDSKNAQDRMDNLIAANYTGDVKLDAVLCSNDSTALGTINALIGASIDPFPLVTGQDCDVANVKYIIDGHQAMSVFKDTRILAAQAVKMVTALMEGTEPEINDTVTYDNGVLVVPTFQCDPVFADVNNYTELLLDSGYYTEDQLL